MDAVGPRLIDVVERAWERGFTLDSDFARNHRNEVAAAASLGFITTKTPQGWSRRWLVTPRGIDFITIPLRDMEEAP